MRIKKLNDNRLPRGLLLRPQNLTDKKRIDLIYDRNHPNRISFDARCDEGVLRCEFAKDTGKININKQFRREVKTVTHGESLKIEVYFGKLDKKKPRSDRLVAVHIGEHGFLLNEQQVRNLGWRLVNRAFDKDNAKYPWPPIKECHECGHIYKPWDDWHKKQKT